MSQQSSTTGYTEPSTSVEKKLLWMIRDLVLQGCTDTKAPITFDGPTPVFSQFIGVFAEAIALLAEYGVVIDLTDNGGRVVSGTMLALVDSAKRLQTGVFNPNKEEAPQAISEIGDYL